jgi:hypothetical protein
MTPEASQSTLEAKINNKEVKMVDQIEPIQKCAILGKGDHWQLLPNEFYKAAMIDEVPKLRRIAEIYRNLDWLQEFDNNPKACLDKIKIIRKAALEMIQIGDKIKPTLVALEKKRAMRKRKLFKWIENKEVNVVGIRVHELFLIDMPVCYRCINRLRNPDGTPFLLKQAAEDDIILDINDTKLSRELKEKGCSLCRMKPRKAEELNEDDRRHPRYCSYCHRPVVYLGS